LVFEDVSNELVGITMKVLVRSM